MEERNELNEKREGYAGPDAPSSAPVERFPSQNMSAPIQPQEPQGNHEVDLGMRENSFDREDL
jgi:hypothetical protein